MDIVWKDFVWEVKPGYSAESAFTKSLKKYVEDYDPNKNDYTASLGGKWKIPGGSFEEITTKLFSFGGYTVNMTVTWMGSGKIGYFFTMNCPQNQEEFEEAKAVDIVPVLQPVFQYASNIDDATKILAAIAAFAVGIGEAATLVELFIQLAPVN